MLRRLLRKLRSQSGQGMSEYLIIVALIAIAAIGVVTVFGRDIRELFSGTTGAISGTDNGQHNARKATVKAKTMKNFGSKTQSGD